MMLLVIVRKVLCKNFFLFSYQRERERGVSELKEEEEKMGKIKKEDLN